jgi:hypothetical protein
VINNIILCTKKVRFPDFNREIQSNTVCFCVIGSWSQAQGCIIWEWVLYVQLVKLHDLSCSRSFCREEALFIFNTMWARISTKELVRYHVELHPLTGSTERLNSVLWINLHIHNLRYFYMWGYKYIILDQMIFYYKISS